MNRIYRLVWNRVRGCLVVASEIARARGKHGRSATTQRQRWLIALPLGLVPLFALAASPAAMAPLPVSAAPVQPVKPATMPVIPASASPSGGQVSVGSGAISQSGLTTTIDQHSQNLSLNWQSFNIGADSTVDFVQPNAQAIAVNRIADPNGSVILGRLNANGQVFLINPNGVLFGQGAQVNVGGLVASTLDVSDSELGSGTLHFGGDSQGHVVNQGKITANGGYVALVGAQVVNDGTLAANGGSVAMGGGNAVTLNFDGNRLLGLQVDKSTLNALAENNQLIVANGGQVLMSAGAKDALLISTVNNTGVIQAQTVENRAGQIILLGGMQAGATNVAGTLDASAPTGGDGGFIETSAAHVKVADGTRITTLAANGDNGSWLIDPQDFTIADSGGDMTGGTISSMLGNGNVSIMSSTGATAGNGDIFVNDAVNWSANTLTLTAARNIDINAVMTASGSAGLALNPTTANGADAVVNATKSTVNIMPGLGRVDFTGSGNSLLVNGTPYTFITSLAELQGISSDLGGHYALRNNIDASATAGWNPDGNGGFAGFDPLGIDDYAGTSFTGVFDGLGHTIDNLTINRPNTDYVGVFGYIGTGSIVRNVGLQGGSTRGRDSTGALVGYSNSGLISNAYATGNVHGGNNVGGLIGYHISGKLPDHLYATGDVEGSGTVGGLFGYGANTGLYYAYASGNVRGGNAGGLVGGLESLSLWYSYATGDVTGSASAGGLVGKWEHGTLWRSYATGKVTGTGAAFTGGLIGDNEFTTTLYSYWDMDSTGQSQACGGAGAAACSSNGSPYDPIGLSTTAAFQQASYANLDFTNDWYMVEGQTRPFLRFEYTTNISNAHQLQLVNMNLSANYTLASDIDASMTDGSRASGMWSSRGFVPLGTDGAGAILNGGSGFDGSFDGLGFTIDGLTIDRPNASFVGVFGVTGNAGAIRNLGVENGTVHGQYFVGGLVGYNRVDLFNVHAAGDVVGSISQAVGDVGGLVGLNEGNITNAYASGTVSGGILIGGLLGSSLGALTNVYATASAGGNQWVGGLAGQSSGAIVNAYASGTVNGSISIGGLLGENQGSIDSAYATGAVTATGAQVGGLVGLNGLGTITNTYATGSVSGSQAVGGLVGNSMGAISNSYATGAVTGSSETGGLVGLNQDSILGSYWNTDTTGQASGVGNGSGTGVVGGSMVTLSQLATFSSWDISASGGSNAVWRIYEGNTAPLLRAFMTAADASAGNASKTYDGATFGDYGITINRVTPGFWLPGDTPDPSLVLGLAHSNAVNAGSYTLDGEGLYSTQMGYDLDITPGTLVIDPKALTIALTGNLDKVYDGSSGIALTSGNYLLSGFVGNEGAAIIQTTGNYNSKNVADADTVTATLTCNSFSADYGTLLSNYVLPATASGTGHITPLGIAVTADANSKIYDATTLATLSLSSSGVLSGDDVVFSGTGNFADKNVGTNKTITVSSMVAGGADAGNYNYSVIAPTADIIPLGIHVDVSADDKVYDGNTNATAAASSSEILAGDTVDFTIGSASFADKDAGIGKTVTVNSITSSGADAGNYVYLLDPSATADITPRGITVNATASDKVYDATTNAVASLGSSGVLAGDTVSFDGTGHFADKNAGTGKTVTVNGIAASGADAGNYSFNTTATDTADITQLGITVDAVASNKVYDATTNAVVALGSSGILTGDTVTFAGTGHFADKNAGTGKTVAVNDISASGSDAGNYRFNTTATDTADISQRGISVDATASNKVYDATTNAVVALGSGGILAGDSVTFDGTGNFADKNVGNGKVVTVSGIAASGADAGNYRVNGNAGTIAAITPATLTYRAAPASLPTGLAPAGLSGSVQGLVGGESLDEATDGTLAWTSPADSASPAGQYAIDGGGLSALNYVFAQAPDNATALHLVDGSAPKPVGVPSLVASTIAGLQLSDDNEKTHAPYAPDVRVVNGGVRLP